MPRNPPLQPVRSDMRKPSSWDNGKNNTQKVVAITLFRAAAVASKLALFFFGVALPSPLILLLHGSLLQLLLLLVISKSCLCIVHSISRKGPAVCQGASRNYFPSMAFRTHFSSLVYLSVRAGATPWVDLEAG